MAKPTPKAIKKKAKIDCSSFLGSVGFTVSETDETESVETTTGAENFSFVESISLAVTATVLAVVGINFSSC